jgi:hypothetical protein
MNGAEEMRAKALLICAFLMASIFLVVVQPASAALTEDDYDITKYDPRDDVMRARTGGDFKFSPHNNVEITQISSKYITAAIPKIELKMTVEGQIKNSEDYKYAFTVIADGDEYVLAAYQNGAAVGFKMNSDDLVLATATGENTKTLTITFAANEIGPPNSNFDIFGAAIYSIEDSERFLDMAPDKLLLITEPSDLSTVSGSISIKGEVRQYSGGSPSGTIKISIDGNTLEDVSGFDPWSYNLDTTTLTDDTHTIYVEIEGTDFNDEITINIDQDTGNYNSFDLDPVVHVGDNYEYTSVGNPQLSGISLPISSEATTTVTDLTTVEGKEVYQVESHSEGGDDIGYIEFSNTVDRTSWKAKNGFGTVKENTVTNVKIDYRPDTQVNTTTTYSPPLETHNNFQVEVGFANIWTLHTTADAESETTVAGGGEPTHDQYTEPLDVTGECLYYLSTHNVHGNSFSDIYVIKSYYENPGVSVVEFYSPELGVPVQIDTYDASRELMFSLGLSAWFQVPFSVDIDTITFDPAEPKVDSNTDIKVTVDNIGDEAASSVKVTIKDGDREIGEKTISSIPVGQSGEETFPWKPNSEGTHDIKVFLSYQNTPLTDKTVSVEVVKDDSVTNGGIPWILILIIIIIVVVILVVVMMKSRGKKESEAPPPAEAEAVEAEAAEEQTAQAAGGVVVASEAPAVAAAQPPQTQMKQETIQCPSCKNGFTIEYESKPVRVKCPTCGMEGVLN